MTPEQISVLCITAALLALLVLEVLPPGITGLLLIVALVATGVLSAEAGFLGLIDPAPVTVACMFVLSAGIVRTGALGLASDIVTGEGGARPATVYTGILLLVLVLSPFMNNTPLVMVFLPLVLGLSRRMREAPSRLLIPLSYVSMLGGVCTLIGTSSNLVVASSLAHASGGAATLSMFDFTVMGAILALPGTAMILLLRRRLLPERVSLGVLTEKGTPVEFVTEMVVHEGSRLDGALIGDAFAPGGDRGGISVLQLIRGEVIIAPLPDLRLRVGDTLFVRGEPAAIMDLHRRPRSGVVVAAGEASGEPAPARGTPVTLFEVVLPPDSFWIGRTIQDLRPRERYGAALFAIQRRGAHLREKIDRLPLRAGDVLLLQGPPEAIHGLRHSENLLVIEGIHGSIPHTDRAPLALLSIGAFVLLAITGLVAVHVAALLAALAMVLTRCLTAAEAYTSLGWDVLFLIAGTLTLGHAFQETGLAAATATAVTEVLGPLGPRAALGGLFLFTILLTSILSNNAAAAVMTPIAWQIGVAFGNATSPIPFVMAVAFAASCSFLTPIGYQTNLLVYGPGGYRFADFLRLGLPLTALVAALAAVFLPVVY